MREPYQSAPQKSLLARRLRLAHRKAVMSDTIHALTAEIRAFRDARDWKQFHAPKELAVAIAAEAGELLQHFVWQNARQSSQRARERRDDIAGEIADVAILLFELADNLDLNLADAMRAKLAKNELRYPVAKARGSNRKYNEL
jgi:dCTP diphosphatase